MRANDHVTEEQIIDYILGNVDINTKLVNQTHINNCEMCRQVYRSWNEMLDQSEEVEKPSTTVKKKIDIQIEELGLKKTVAKSRKAWVIAGSIAAALVLAIGLFKVSEQEIHTAQSEAQIVHEIQNQPDTDMLEITPVSQRQDVSGNVWINKSNNKMVLEVDGLAETSSHDHQLWIVYRNNKVQGNVLKVKDGFTRVLYTDAELDQWSAIKASLEPVGGSEIPTGPDTFFVDLMNR